MPKRVSGRPESPHHCLIAFCQAREAGISVAKKGVQLWNVGAGLPLDAIKSGSITAWGCSYEISDQEVVSLVDALGKNDSLERLDLSIAGFEWMPPVKREERSAISTLLTVMNGDDKALESLEKLIISQTTRFEIPVLDLRSGPEKVHGMHCAYKQSAHLPVIRAMHAGVECNARCSISCQGRSRT